MPFWETFFPFFNFKLDISILHSEGDCLFTRFYVEGSFEIKFSQVFTFFIHRSMRSKTSLSCISSVWFFCASSSLSSEDLESDYRLYWRWVSKWFCSSSNLILLSNVNSSNLLLSSYRVLYALRFINIFPHCVSDILFFREISNKVWSSPTTETCSFLSVFYFFVPFLEISTTTQGKQESIWNIFISIPVSLLSGNTVLALAGLLYTLYLC